MSSPPLEGGANAAERGDTGNAEALDLLGPVVEEVVDASEELPILGQIIGSEEVHGRIARQRREVASVVETLALVGEAGTERRPGKWQPSDDRARKIVRA